MIPIVTFVVPCYKLAHLLDECVQSIIAQTYGAFEVLIMDDSSPDNTPEIAGSYRDPRIKYIRNPSNLGHLRNYNKGISLALGKYVWLISADDYLRHPRILERYVALLDSNPRIGYTFCSGVSLANGRETEVLGSTLYSRKDCVVSGHVFLRTLLKANIVLAASGLVRRECYEKISLFPLSREMGWSGDWYLWCLFALFYDVGYFAEPMVCYRRHELSMTNVLKEQNSDILTSGDIVVPWLIKQKADAAGFSEISRYCLESLEYVYSRLMARNRCRLSRQGFEESLCRHSKARAEKSWVRARVYEGVGDIRYWQGRLRAAKVFYLASLQQRPWRVSTYAKIFLLALGEFGRSIRRNIRIAVERGEQGRRSWTGLKFLGSSWGSSTTRP